MPYFGSDNGNRNKDSDLICAGLELPTKTYPKMESRYGAAEMPMGRGRDASAAFSIPEVAVQNDVPGAVRVGVCFIASA